MVISGKNKPIRQHMAGMLMTELAVALAFLCVAVLPLAFAFSHEHNLLRATYHRAIAMEIVDGEMELLLAGGWKQYSNGVYLLKTEARSAENLPAGRLQLSVTNEFYRLEWMPTQRHQGGAVIREVRLP